ncbi:MAG: thermonuclease family protein [Candidatus Marithrix sp.]
MRNTKSLLTLVRQLRRKKYPLAFIVVIVTLSLIMDNCTNPISNISQNSSDECQVLKIYDGDTMTLQCPNNPKKTKVRMYCIDTPEMRQKPWGTQARDYLRSITGKTVRLVKIDKDRYGRIVGEVYSNGVNLNLAQVKAGQAAVYTRYCKKSEYKAAERPAKQAKLGIWSKTGLHQTPWQWRKNNR